MHLIVGGGVTICNDGDISKVGDTDGSVLLRKTLMLYVGMVEG
jgi:hypothetical protein